MENSKIVKRKQELEISMRVCIRNSKEMLEGEIAGTRLRENKSKSTINYKCPYHWKKVNLKTVIIFYFLCIYIIAVGRSYIYKTLGSRLTFRIAKFELFVYNNYRKITNGSGLNSDKDRVVVWYRQITRRWLSTTSTQK